MSDQLDPHRPWYQHRMTWVLTIFLTTYLLVPTITHPVVDTIVLLLGIWLSADATRRAAPQRAGMLTLATKSGCIVLVLMSGVRYALGGELNEASSEISSLSLALFGAVATAAAFGLLRYVVAQPRVGFDQIAGAICVYYLLAVIWASLYLLLFVHDPGAFKGIDPAEGDFDPLYLVYFSMVTLTTLGYGDISPVNKLGGTLATMEAFVGQVYLTVLVARLVGLYIAQESSDPPRAAGPQGDGERGG